MSYLGRRYLPVNIVADENVNYGIISALRQNDWNVVAVADEHRGITDADVLGLARRHEAVLITEDKDFGEWVFAHHATDVGILLLRYSNKPVDVIVGKLLIVLRIHGERLRRRFVVITPEKIRIRDL